MKLIKKISFIFLLIFVFFIPFSITWTNIFLYLSIFLVVIDRDLYKKNLITKISSEEKWLILFAFTYLLFCGISLFWSEDVQRELQLIGRYILILCLPFFLCLMKAVGALKRLNLPIYSFILGVLCSSFVCLYLSYRDSWEETENGFVFNSIALWKSEPLLNSIIGGYNHFTYHFLSHFIHPSYLSLYFLFAIVFVLEKFKTINRTFYKVLLSFFIVYSIGFIFLLQSRGNYLAFFSVFFIGIVFNALIKRSKILLILGLCFLIFGAIFIFKHTRLASISSDIENVLSSNNTEQLNNVNSANARLVIWRNAFQVIKQHPILGVGIGDTDTELEKQYKKNGVDFEFGTHNQYIYAQLSMGILGLLLLLAMLLVPLYFGIKNRYFPLIGFSVAVMINLLFENMLTRNAGLMFIPWATMLLLMMSEEKKKEISNE